MTFYRRVICCRQQPDIVILSGKYAIRRALFLTNEDSVVDTQNVFHRGVITAIPGILLCHAIHYSMIVGNKFGTISRFIQNNGRTAVALPVVC